MDIEHVIGEKAHLIDREIESVFPKTGIDNLHNVVWYHMDAGGKRIRPILAIMTFEALGKDSRKILPFAAACEVLHNWFLVHDDIEDGDQVRRDKPAVWVKFGLAHGINVGDFMAQKVFELILNSKLDDSIVLSLVKAMTTAAVKTAEGQAMDINLRNSHSPSEKQYMDMVTGKTAHYLTLPMVGAAIAAKADERTIESIIDFGRYIGPAFQITDDILDLTQGKGRGEIGRDIKEGKRSILVVHALAHCSQKEKEQLIQILNKLPGETSDEDVAYAKKLFEKYGSVEYARQKAEDLSVKAKNVAKGIPKLREILDFFADYLVKRSK